MPSKTVLLAWELGGGLGHARRLLAIALALHRQGWRPIVAAREVWACAAEYRHADVPLIQAPLHRGLSPAEGARFQARSFADMVAACGYRRVEELYAVVSAWDRLIDMIQPSVIIADYSPLLSLAAHGRVPLVAIGDGFVLPPPHLPQMPLLRPDGAPIAEESQLLANAAVVQRGRGLAVPRSLPAVIGGQAHVVCTYPETDIYAGQRQQPASGPIGSSPPRVAPPAGGAIFAYLAADEPRVPELLRMIVGMGFSIEAFLRGAPDQMKQALRASGMSVHDEPPPLAEVAERASLVIHHAGIGTIETCLALGRPQLLLPRHLEQSLNASTAVRLGTALSLSRSSRLSEASAVIAEAAGSRRLVERAQELAAVLAGRPAKALDEIVARCDALSSG
jgi:UDP-N-acetylglucosamine transferase subunit ALG13